MLIEKPKLPKGMSYPLKSSRFEEALAAADISISVHLIHGSRSSFEAFFWPPIQVEYERPYVRSGMVSAVDGRRARRWVDEGVIPELVTWLSKILALDARAPARMQEQSFSRSLLPPPDWE